MLTDDDFATIVGRDRGGTPDRRQRAQVRRLSALGEPRRGRPVRDRRPGRDRRADDRRPGADREPRHGRSARRSPWPAIPPRPATMRAGPAALGRAVRPASSSSRSRSPGVTIGLAATARLRRRPRARARRRADDGVRDGRARRARLRLLGPLAAHAAWRGPRNPALVASVVLSSAFLASTIYVGPLHEVFATVSLGATELGIVLALSLFPAAAVELVKAVRRRSRR